MTSGEPIAIVGMACRFAGAPNLEEYWRVLVEGRDTVSEVPPDRWDVNQLYDPDQHAPGKVRGRWGGFLGDVDRFDAAFFGISPREAPHVDPRQRLMLEVAWEALEDAGIAAETIAGSQTGVYVATLTNDFDQLLARDLTRFQSHTGIGTANSAVANRLSYFLDLHGPSIVLDTACSGSLVALDLACRDLHAGHTTLALAGGVSVNLLPSGDVFFSRAGALSADGRCKTFDAGASGMVRGEGAGLVVLKPLARALADGNRVYAVIRATAVHHDGRSNGIMAPNGRAQEALLRDAYRRAGIAPRDVQYVEAHGTGTPIGDPIEVGALAAVLGEGRGPDAPCALGSLKTNLGHPEAAAGVAGVIKVALALSRGIIPPVVHFRELHPLIAALDFPVRIPQAPIGWPDPTRRRIAGVSGFGFAGTIAHAVLEEAPPAAATAAPPREAAASDAAPCVLPLSARSPEALAALAGRYAAFLRGPGAAYAPREISRAAALGRSQLDYRLAVAGDGQNALATKLARFAAGEDPGDGVHVGGPVGPDRPPLVYVFSGQGAHWLGMGRELWAHEPVFRRALEACTEAHARLAGWRLVDELLADADATRLDEIDVAQPLIFAYQVALAALWRSWGVVPDVVLGQSLGEIAAAHVAGALTLEDAVRVVWHRSRLLKTRVGMGRTAVVGLPLAAAEQELAGYEARLGVAGSTGPSTSVISGDPAALEAVLDRLARRDVFYRVLDNVDVAAHSPHMDPLLPELAAALHDLRPRAAAIPMLSTVTGDYVDGERLDAAYWTRNLREPFRFAEAVATLIEEGHEVFLEISSHPVLGGAIRQSLARLGRAGAVLDSTVRDAPERQQLLSTVGALFTLGYPLDWARIYPEGGRHVALPHYPWQRERYWFEELSAGADPGKRAGAHPLLGERTDSPAWPGQHLWELDLRAHSLRYLRDHRVQGMVLLPGAAFVEMAQAAATDAGLPDGWLADLSFERALALTDDAAARLQVALSPAPGGGSLVEIFSRPADDTAADAWTRHAVATLTPATPPDDASAPDLAALQRACPEPVDAAAFYAAMERRGIEYGPAFQVVRELWRGERAALGRIELADLAAAEAGAYRVHPTLLDGALQVVAAALPAEEASTYLPRAIGRLCLARGAPVRVWCHARLDAASAPGAPELCADLLLYDESGRLVGRVERFTARRLGDAEPAPPSGADLLHEVRWQPAPPPAAPARRGTSDWLLLADAGGFGAHLATDLEARGERCLLVMREELRGYGEEGAGDAFAALLAEVTAARRAPLQGIVYLWALDEPIASGAPGDDAADAGALHIRLVARLVRALAEAAPARFPKLWLVTRRAQALPGDTGGLALGAAPLWGLGRVVALEHPEIWGAAVDLEGSDLAADATRLAADLCAPGEEDQLAYRGGERWVPRLERAEPPATPRPPVVFRPEACYLITGGLTGVGLETARWMARQGARRLLLLGRTPLPPRHEWRDLPVDDPAASRVAAVRDLEALGATVYAFAADVGDPAQLARVLEKYERQSLAPIRGVVHSAAVLHDALLVRADERAFDAVLRTKAAGAWHLDRLTRAMPLDFFVLYSSMSSLVGQFGQGAYAAANAFLDALAHQRRAAGLPALAINWGPWAEVGLVARGAADGQLAAVHRIAPAEGLAALARLLGWDRAQAAVVGADWGALPRTPFLADLVTPPAAPDDAGPAPEGDLLELLALPRAERAALLTERLRAEAARVLRLDVARLSVGRPLTTFGMDSILAVELRNRLQARYHVQLSLVELFTASVARLAERVAELVEADDELERALAEVEQLSAEQARTLLVGTDDALADNSATGAEPPAASGPTALGSGGAERVGR